MAAFAFEAQHRIDHMLKDARPGDAAILGHMTDENDGRTAFLGKADQLAGRSADLTDRARSAFDKIRMHCLDRVDNEEIGRFRESRENVAH